MKCPKSLWMVEWPTYGNNNANFICSKKLKPLEYQQHTYAIIGTIHRYLSKCLQHIFININHWPFVHIHATTLHLHCIIYNSNTLKTKNLPNDIVQLLIKILNVKHLLYMYANVMQHLDGLSCGILKIAYVTDITFGFNLEHNIFTLCQKLWLHLHNNINNKNTFPFPEHIII